MARPAPEAVTFDCWSTLLFEHDSAASYERRVQAVARAAGELGLPHEPGLARQAMDAAWRRHWTLWHEHVSSGAAEMAGWALDELAGGRDLPHDSLARVAALATELGETSLAADVRSLPGARDTLERLAEAGVRRALICDTGMTPGRVVRQLLDRGGLLEVLEITVFSDEAGVPKPHPRIFVHTLEALGVAPDATVHVGDLRRTDVAGARAAGMGTVRIRHTHDDLSDHPEADEVAGSHASLVEILLGWAEGGSDPEADSPD